MSYHVWLLTVKKARRTFYLKKMARLFGVHIIWLIEQDQENGLDALQMPYEKRRQTVDSRKSLELEVSV